ncbi:tRNA pseudouridine(38-40) synthase TruA [Thalassotalea sp. HSM 43]|uniref:tRNA pseudouridine(38-40) synthase TruA n=1 Tax=Thalassotalea sp. HSM 43 TaxID=2552945 RepID=UPI001081A4BC|nr:tRNA pseudouridine(38-40) synthase TruA [Thalassotalea sp. HSM 43]QBY05295.1 tRNA pseudouridine(38-40) synthase TruA [Thalassotalea sp. HSM 43]
MRFALGIEYDGSNYCGWQRQNHVNSVQQELEKALSKVVNQPTEVICAGRTDTGVHGTGQVIHFESPVDRQERAWTLGVNTNLPKDIVVKWGKRVDDDFHARFSATARQYKYIIYNSPCRPAIFHKGLSFCYYPLDEKLMHQAAQQLVGTHDFTSYRTVHCQANSPLRTVLHCNVSRVGSYVIVDIKANAFLHHMVRNIVGSLMRVGRRVESIEWISEVLAQRNRCMAGITAPSGGLYFVDVDYPEHFNIPKPEPGPLFLSV